MFDKPTEGRRNGKETEKEPKKHGKSGRNPHTWNRGVSHMIPTDGTQTFRRDWGFWIGQHGFIWDSAAGTCIVGIYFYTQLRSQQKSQPSHRRDSGRELEKLQKLRTLPLSEPLAEKVRPAKFSDIVGQEDGIKSLKAILCGRNPQHVIIYSPPGIGKTCAARLVLEAAKKSPGTHFRSNAPFIEMDATCVRFDELAIADAIFL